MPTPLSSFKFVRVAASLVIAYAVALALSVEAQAKVRHGPIVITKPIDKSSPKINPAPPAPPAPPIPMPYPNQARKTGK